MRITFSNPLLPLIPFIVVMSGTLPRAVRAADSETSSFGETVESMKRRLEESVQKLNRVREETAEVTIPLSRELSRLENELIQARQNFQSTSRLLDNHTLDLSNLRTEIKSRNEEAAYLSTLFGEYIRNFESRLHIAELQRYEDALEAARLAPEDSTLFELDVFRIQAGLLGVSLERLEALAGGSVFEGHAVDPSGLVRDGHFALVGPAALFLSEDGSRAGTAEQRLGSLEPTIIEFGSPEDTAAATELIRNQAGEFPLDPTLGSAHKIEETEETLVEHARKGGPVMVPILGLAAAALLVALFKWAGLAMVQRPAPARVRLLLEALASGDRARIQEEAGGLTRRRLDWSRGWFTGAAAGMLIAALVPIVRVILQGETLDAVSISFPSWLAVAICAVVGGGLEIGLRYLINYSPVAAMLAAGAQHVGKPQELIEEVMYERVLTTRLKLERMLPFVAICASSAPLLGLLGTVTGIINTFKLITVFGSGDVKTLSGGISEALITTEFGLIVAIPSLLLHAFLARKVQGVINEMEKAAVSLLNQLGKVAPDAAASAAAAAPVSAARTAAPIPTGTRSEVGGAEVTPA